MEHENGYSDILTVGEEIAERRGRAWGVAALTGYGITPVDRIVSECVIEGNVREREEAAGISTGRYLQGVAAWRDCRSATIFSCPNRVAHESGVSPQSSGLSGLTSSRSSSIFTEA